MSELDDLYAAVLADPESDAPRLVYADALQALGHERGEFIAIQCELARLGCDRTRVALWDWPDQVDGHGRRDWLGDGLVDGDWGRIRALRAREAQLFDSGNRVTWASPWLEHGYRFHRGFVDHVFISDYSHRDHVWEKAPLVRSIELSQRGVEPYEDERFAQLDQLRVTMQTLEERAAFFTECVPRLQLRELAYSDQTDDPTGWYELPPELLRRLRGLDLYGARLGSIEELFAIAPIADLRIGHNSRIGTVLEQLAQCGTTLQILDCYLLEAGLGYRAFANAPALAGLQALRVHERRTMPNEPAIWLDDPDSIAAVVSLPSLRVLDVGGCLISKRALRTMIETERLAAVIQLGLRSCQLDDDHIELLVRSPLFDRLRALDLANNELTERSARALETAAGGERLVRLDLRASRIEESHAEQLRGRFPNAEILVGEEEE